MGLAAGQARLITLVSRKSDVEGQLMHIANQRLAQARDAAALSREYTDALNAQKLMFNNGQADVDVSWNLLMNPIGSSQYAIVGPTGAVILSDKMASFLGGGKSGKPDINDTGTAAAFIAGMTGAAVTPDNIPAIKAGVAPTNTAPKSTSAPSVDLKSIPGSYKDSDVFSNLGNRTFTDVYMADKYGDDSNAQVGYGVGGASYNNTSGNGGTPFCFWRATSNSEEPNPNSIWVSTLKRIIDDISDDTTAALAKTLGVPASSIASAASTAKTQTENFYRAQLSNIQIYCTNDSNNTPTKEKAQGSNQIWDEWHGRQDLYIDPNQVVLTFLTYFDAACKGVTDFTGVTKSLNGPSATIEKIDYEIDNHGNLMQGGDRTSSTPARNASGASSSSSSSSTRASNATAGAISGGSAGIMSYPGSDRANIAVTPDMVYYYHLFELICQRGWVKDDNITNSKYLQWQMMQGNAGVMQYKNGQWASMSMSDVDSPFSEKNDKEAGDKAEAKYEAAQDELDFKGKVLDIQQNNLDTERSALTTEIDSVKKIIEKATEVFKLFQQA